MSNILTMMVIFSSTDGENWYLVERDDIPAFLHDTETVAALADGMGCTEPGSDVTYIGLAHNPMEVHSDTIKTDGGNHAIH